MEDDLQSPTLWANVLKVVLVSEFPLSRRVATFNHSGFNTSFTALCGLMLIRR